VLKPVVYRQSGTVLKIALRAVVCELQRPKDGQFQREIFGNAQNQQNSTIKSLNGGHVDLADTPVVFLWELR
jgi:hypothetical protein